MRDDLQHALLDGHNQLVNAAARLDKATKMAINTMYNELRNVTQQMLNNQAEDTIQNFRY